MTDDSRNDLTNSALEAEFAWITQLAPAADDVKPEPASGQAQRAYVLAIVGQKPLEWGIQLGYHVAEQIRREVPGFVSGEAGFEALRTGTESTTLQLLTVLAGAQVESATTPESYAAVTDFVRRRLSLDDMLRSIQVGHAAMASAFMAAGGRLGDPADSLVQMQALSERMFRFFHVFSADMASHYRSEEQRWAGSDTAAKLAVVTDVLDGMPPDAVAERKLGYAFSGAHVAIVANGPDSEADALAAAVGGILAAAGCTHRIVLEAAPGVVWAWGSPADSARTTTALTVSSLPAGSHAIAGGIEAGPEGFRLSHREASAALTLLEGTPSSGRAVLYAEVDLLSLLLADPERARAYTARELGPLAAPTPQAKDLRRTVAAFIDERGSPHAAAQRLTVSRNTVSYRVARAEELLGRSINVRRLQLRCALLIQEMTDAAAEPSGQRSAHPR